MQFVHRLVRRSPEGEGKSLAEAKLRLVDIFQNVSEIGLPGLAGRTFDSAGEDWNASCGLFLA